MHGLQVLMHWPIGSEMSMEPFWSEVKSIKEITSFFL